MNKMRLFGVIIISGALLLGSVGTTLAQDEVTPTPELISETGPAQQGLFGTVIAIDESSVTLQTKAQGEVVIALTEGETIYTCPGQYTTQASGQEQGGQDGIIIGGWDCITVGSRLAIQAASDDQTGTYTAIRVMTIPETPTRRHLSGVVVSVENQIMTITNADGEILEIEIPEGVRGGVVGDFISAAVRQNTRNGKPELTGTQTAEQIRERLRAHIGEMDSDTEAQTEAEAQIQTRAQLRQRLNEQLEGLMERHENALRNALQRRANTDSEGALGDALRQMQQTRDQVREQVRIRINDDTGNGNGSAQGQQRGRN